MMNGVRLVCWVRYQAEVKVGKGTTLELVVPSGVEALQRASHTSTHVFAVELKDDQASALASGLVVVNLQFDLKLVTSNHPCPGSQRAQCSLLGSGASLPSLEVPPQVRIGRFTA